MKIQETILGDLEIEEFLMCAPTCPTCVLDRIAQVEKAVKAQWGFGVDPYRAAVTLVLGSHQRA